MPQSLERELFCAYYGLREVSDSKLVDGAFESYERRLETYQEAYRKSNMGMPREIYHYKDGDALHIVVRPHFDNCYSTSEDAPLAVCWTANQIVQDLSRQFGPHPRWDIVQDQRSWNSYLKERGNISCLIHKMALNPLAGVEECAAPATLGPASCLYSR